MFPRTVAVLRVVLPETVLRKVLKTVSVYNGQTQRFGDARLIHYFPEDVVLDLYCYCPKTGVAATVNYTELKLNGQWPSLHDVEVKAGSTLTWCSDDADSIVAYRVSYADE